MMPCSLELLRFCEDLDTDNLVLVQWLAALICITKVSVIKEISIGIVDMRNSC